MFQVCRKIRRMSSVAAVAAENAIDHGADNRNTIAGASIIAIAGVVASAAVVDRAAVVVTAAAGADDNTTATSVASRSTSATGVTSSISATSGAGHRVSAAMSGKGLSAATMTTILMAGSQRIRRHWHATQRDRGCESDKSFFVKHVILLCFKQKFVCDCTDNTGSPLRVARHRDTFACETAMCFALVVHALLSRQCLTQSTMSCEQFCTDSTGPSDDVRRQHQIKRNHATA
jgi:hypothetical protein